MSVENMGLQVFANDGTHLADIQLSDLEGGMVVEFVEPVNTAALDEAYGNAVSFVKKLTSKASKGVRAGLEAAGL